MLRPVRIRRRWLHRWIDNHKADAAVLCIHQSVDGARVGPQDYTFHEKPDVIDAAAIQAGLTAVLAGHIHRHQVLTRDLSGRQMSAPVFYPGAIERTSYAEKNEDKGYLMLTIKGSQTVRGRLKCWRFHHLPARPMIRLDLQLNQRGADNVTARIEDMIRTLPDDAIVQLRLYGQPEKSVLERIRAASLRRLAPETMNIEAVLVGQRREGQRWRTRRRKSGAQQAPTSSRRPWQRPLFDYRQKRKTEP